MARREHVYGPYRHKNGWSIVHVRGGERSTVVVEDEVEAQRRVAEARAKLQGRQVSDAVAAFLERERRRGIRPSSITTLGYRLRAVLQVDVDGPRTGGPIAELTPARAARLLDKYEASVDTRKGALAACRAFGTFTASKSWTRTNPFEACEVEGRKRRGKKQLTVDEAREFFAIAMERADAGDRGAVAALLYVVLGCRSSELRERVVRDIDNRGTVLVIPRGKTENAPRRLAIPAELQPYVTKLVMADGRRRPTGAFLFDRGDGRPPTNDWARYQVHKLCRAAGVPLVCTHSLRGLQSTLATAANATAEAVAAQLGHASPAITRRHYLAPGAAESARGRTALSVLAGGRA
jgi:integrase